MNMYVDGVLAMTDSTTAGGAIVYPAASYTASNGGWFTVGAYHDANEYYSFPGAIDELKVWHVAQEPQIGCSPVDSPDLNYYWMFDDNPVSLAQSDPRRVVMSTSAKLSEQTAACRSAHLPTAARWLQRRGRTPPQRALSRSSTATRTAAVPAARPPASRL